MSDASYLTPVRTWMGRYPRKGADWSPEEDKALIREYESGRYLTKEIASRHLREPVAIERRIELLRKRALDKLAAIRPERNWRGEREAAQESISKIKDLFSASMWPRPKGKSILPIMLRALTPGDTVMHEGVLCVVKAVTIQQDSTRVAVVALTDLPPEVAQALQFGGES